MVFNKNKAKILAIIVLIAGAVLTIINMVLFQSSISKTEISNDTGITNYKYHFALVYESKNNEKWGEIYESAKKYAIKHDAYIDVIGNNLQENYTKLELLDIAILSEADGIIVEGDDSYEMAEYIKQAYEKHIPVVTVMTDAPNSMRISYVGLGSYDIGKEFGEQIGNLCNNSSNKDVMVLMNESDGYQEQHTMYQAILENKPAADCINIDARLVNNDNEFSTDEAIRDILVNMNKLPDVMVCLSDKITESAYQQAVEYNKVKIVDVIGLASSRNVYEAVEKNLIDCVLSFDKMEMGVDCVDALIEYIENGYVSEYYMVETNLVNQKNVRRFINEGKK